MSECFLAPRYTRFIAFTSKNWKQIPAILMFEFPGRRHFGSYYVIRLPLLLSNNGSFVHRFPKGMVETMVATVNASSHPNWQHAENPNFKIADICF